MQTISVALQKKSYPIWIENGLLDKLSNLLSPLNKGQKWILFSQNNILENYEDQILNILDVIL